MRHRKASITVYFYYFLYFLPIRSVVAVKLSQSELLQFDLQLLVLPLQVNDHAVQEVDLMETNRDTDHLHVSAVKNREPLNVK